MRFLPIALLITLALCLLLPTASTAYTNPSSHHHTAEVFAPFHSSNDFSPDTVRSDGLLTTLFFELLSSTGGSIQAIAMNGSAVFVGQGGTLLVFENQSAATPVARLALAGFVQSIAVENTVAAVALGTSGVQLVDISNPPNPSLGKLLKTPGAATSVQIANEQIYVTMTGFEGGVFIADISNPQNPISLGTITTSMLASATAVDIVADIAYVAAGRSEGIQMFDVSNPVSSTLLGETTTPAAALDIQVVRNTAYVAADTAGLLAITISNPANPQMLDKLALDGRARSVHITADTAYVATGNNGFAWVDVRDPTNLQLLGSLEVAGEAEDIQHTPTEEQLWVAATGGGLHVFHLSNPLTPTLQTHYQTLYGALDVQVSGTQAFVAAEEQGVALLDVRDPQQPHQQSTISLDGAALALAVADEQLFVAADTAGMVLLDVSNPLSPTIRSNLRLPGRAADISLATAQPPTSAYIAAGSSGVHIVDVSNPLSPTLQASYATPGSARSIQVIESLAYVADTEGLRILDVSTPISPTLQGELTLQEQQYLNDVSVQGNLAYLALSGANGGLLIVDVQDPTNPLLVGTLDGEGTAIVVANEHAYLSTVSQGIQMIDVQNPTAPMLVRSYATPGVPHGLSAQGEHIYVADFSGGMHILRLKEAEGFVFLPSIAR